MRGKKVLTGKKISENPGFAGFFAQKIFQSRP
jgi:hypothetical protein